MVQRTVPFSRQDHFSRISPSVGPPVGGATAYIRSVLGRNFTLTVHADGCYTVTGEGLSPITFAKQLTGRRT
jgi:hypothetical protein